MSIKVMSPKNMGGQRVVVLGASGFIGKALATALVSRKATLVAPTSKELDLSDPQSSDKLKNLLKPQDIVVFISALTPDRGKDRNTLLKNIQMAHQFCNGLAGAKPAYVLYVSSDAVYGDQWAVRNEDTPCNPSSFHGMMHCARELMVTQLCQTEKVSLGIIRPVAVYGAGDTHQGYGPNRYIKSARSEGSISLFGGGEEKRDHLYIEDLVELCMRCIVSQTSGVYNAASGTSTTFFDVANAVKAVFVPNAIIKTSPRGGPVTHIHYDTVKVLKTFPDLRMSTLNEGLTATREILKNN